jgi:RNA polymerase sigma-70 factor, ECF subfamily
MSDYEAIERMKQGDIDGLEGLVLRYQVEAVRAAFLISQDRELAEDIVQSAFLHAYERIQQFDESRAFGPWFQRIVVNSTLKALKRGARNVSLDVQFRQEYDLLGDSAEHEPSVEERLEDKLDRYETNEALSIAISQLPPEQRAALVMRYYLELSDTEISSRLDCTPGTVRWRLYRARERLRRLLQPFSQERRLADTDTSGPSGQESDARSL